jgi:hypothetical protein
MLAAAFAVAVLLLAGTVGYQQYAQNSDPGLPTTIPAAFIQDGTPTGTGCEAEPREPGSVAEIVETPQTLMPYLPRFGADPMYGPNQDRPLASGDFLLNNSTPDDSVRPQIETTLQQLHVCRFYALTSEGTNTEGRYFALFSDDFLRRELRGYQEAGMELELHEFWSPQTLPVVEEIRHLHGFEQAGFGNQYLAILETPENVQRELGTLVIVFVEEGGRWLVDEVGYADMPSGDASPVPATPVPGAWVDRMPHMLDIAIYDSDPMGTPPAAACDTVQGTPVSCGFTGYQKHGPWWFNEFPANTDFKMTFYNLGQQSHRVEIEDLGISIELPPDSSESFVLNTEPGEYLFTIYEGDQPEPVSTGVFTVISADDSPSMG